MKRFPWQMSLVVALAILAAVGQGACGAGGDSAGGWDTWDAASDGARDWGADADADAGSEWGGADADADAAAEVDTWLPPEDEELPDFHAPQGSNRFVYLSNPIGDNVVVIDSQRLTLDLVEVGDTPTELKTLGTRDAAVVIDSGSDDVAVIRTTPGVGSDVSFEAIAPGANALSVSPDGSYGISFFDADSGDRARPPNMQEVTLLVFEPVAEQLALRTTVRAAPGPVAVDWTDDGAQAFVIGRTGLSVVDFALVGPGYHPTHISFGTIPDPADPFGSEIDREIDNVDVSGDGRLAVLAQEGQAEILVLDLDTQVISPVALPAAPTDVDLAPDGSFALAALRDLRQVALVELAEPTEPVIYVTAVTGVVPGQVVLTPDSRRAVLFSNAATFEVIGVLDMETGETTAVPLKKSVRAVAVTPDGEVAVVIHNKKGTGTPGDPYLDPNDPTLDPVDDLEEIIDRTWGFSLVRFSDGLVVRHETPCDPGAWLVFADAHKAFLTLRDDARGIRDVLVADLIDFIADSVHLGSPPVSLGLAPLTRKVFVGQDHATGRISFISADTGSVQTVTGFQLNDWIVE
ncbi:MAG: hypothetical protein HY907_05465 [Deltaproteobacteria bacterium]|nr:hypothetical protein [Deltaproteobacteria bacterium]